MLLRRAMSAACARALAASAPLDARRGRPCCARKALRSSARTGVADSKAGAHSAMSATAARPRTRIDPSLARRARILPRPRVRRKMAPARVARPGARPMIVFWRGYGILVLFVPLFALFGAVLLMVALGYHEPDEAKAAAMIYRMGAAALAVSTGILWAVVALVASFFHPSL